jgi:hypothetical protein
VHQPGRIVPTPPHTTLAHSTGTMDAVDVRRPPASRRGLLIGATAMVVAAGVAAVMFTDLLSPPARRHRRATAASVDDTSADEPTPPSERKRIEPPTEPPAPITVEVEGGPSDLEVLVDGVQKPLPLSLPRDGAVHRLVLRAPGYVAETRVIEASRSQTIAINLAHEERKPEKVDRPDRRPRRPHHGTTAPGANVPDPIIDL